MAAIEFALVAPVLLLSAIATFDIARAYIICRQVFDAALAIAAAGEKLSVVPGGQGLTALTSGQMQQALTSIYTAIPGLALGKHNGMFPGAFSATLSEVVFCPTLTPATASYNSSTCPEGTGAQAASVLWSTTLQLPANASLQQPRACGVLYPEYPTWNSNPKYPNATRAQQFLDPSDGGTNGAVLAPQIVADVSYTYTPSFLPPLLSVFTKGTSFTFTATVPLSNLFGSSTQAITYATTPASSYSVTSCTP